MSFWTPQVARGSSDFLGATVEGTYKITAWLPTSEYGAVGHVWVAVGPEGRNFVVKTPKQANSQAWQKELRGAKAVHDVRHENLMTVEVLGEQICPIPSERGPIGTPGATLQFIVIEYCTKLDMFSYCEKSPFSPALARHYFKQLTAGIDCMHKVHGAHRDLKPDNLLLSRLLTLKIGDFGFARDVAGAAEFTLQTGTPLYSSPEAQAAGGHASADKLDPLAQDVWMMGCCLFILLTNTFPFEGEKPREAFFAALDPPDAPFPPTHAGYWRGQLVLRSGKRPGELQRKFLNDPRLVDLLNRMWDRDFRRRITTEQILEHPWITHKQDGTPWEEYDMGAAVMRVARGGMPEPGSLLAEMCSKLPGNTVIDMIRKDNAAYL